MSNNKKGLGRGLGALLSDNHDYLEALEQREQKREQQRESSREPETSSPLARENNSSAVSGYSEYMGSSRNSENGQNSRDNAKVGPIELPVGEICRNENQPRKVFDDAAMSELVNSIRIHGVITPIIVVKKDENYMIIAGERRWRAARKAGLPTIPAIVRNYTPLQIKEISLIENLQREDLNPIETANAIKQLMQDYSYTQEAVAERIGKSRSAVANALGLLTLAPAVIDLVSTGRLSPGHAKILTAIEDKKLQLELALKGCDGKMSVRKFEQLIKQVKNPQSAARQPEISLELKDLIHNMQRVFATKVSAIGNDNKGRIYIDYYSRDDLDRLFDLLEILKSQPTKD